MKRVINYKGLVVILSLFIVAGLYIYSYYYVVNDVSANSINTYSNTKSTQVEEEPLNSEPVKNHERSEIKQASCDLAGFTELQTEKNRELIVYELLSALKKINSSKLQASFFERSGVGRQLGKQILKAYYPLSYDSFTFTGYADETRELQLEQEKLFALLSDENYFEVAKFLGNSETLKTSIFLGDNKLYTPFSFILKHVQKSEVDNDVLLELVPQLILNNVPVNLFDIVYFTDKSAPQDAIIDLVSKFEGDIQRGFFYEPYNDHFNLATLSAKNGSIELLNYWLSQGVPSELNSYASTSVDYVADLTPDKMMNAISLLADYQAKANYSGSLSAIKTKSTGAFLIEHAEYISTLDMTELNDSEIALVTRYSTNIFNAALTNIETNSACLVDENFKKNVVQLILTASKQKTINMVVGLRHTLNNTQNVTESEQVVLVKPVSRQTSRIESSDSIQDMQGRHKALLKQGKWREVYNELSPLYNSKISESSSLGMAFILALQAGASDEVLIDILDSGAMVPKELVASLITHCELSTLEVLYSKGYDFSFISNNGYGAMASAVGTQNLDKVKFMINIGVPVNVDDEKVQPLNTAIVLSRGYKKIGLNIVKLLLESGAKISEKDRLYISNLKSNNFERYMKLRSMHSALQI